MWNLLFYMGMATVGALAFRFGVSKKVTFNGQEVARHRRWLIAFVGFELMKVSYINGMKLALM